MDTKILKVNAASMEWAASLIRDDEVVAFPTETVYGLGADALRQEAVLKVFAAKERPADNPLIAHIADASQIHALVRRVDKRALMVMEAFWPGPLTIVLEKSDRIPDAVSAGLPTVAVRMPGHPDALALIRAAGTPIAAPSANRSGRPSPTTAMHVMEDMGGRIPLILDGGPCAVGLESTVLDLTSDVPVILRPGGVTPEMLRAALPEVRVDPAVLRPLREGAQARSPGMKHRHYAPKGRVTVISGKPDAVAAKARALYMGATSRGRKAAILCAAPRVEMYGECAVRTLGGNAEEMAASLFDALRAMDEEGVEQIFAEAVQTDGIGLALMNRLLRAADFDVVEA